SAGALPQWGTVSAVDAASTAAAGRWVLPNPAAPATPPVSGAQLFALGLQNTGTQTLTVRVMALTPAGERPLAGVPVLQVPPGVFTVVEPDVLAAAGTDPLLLEADGPLAAMEEGSPAGVPGAVALAAIPLG
ncbi:MAG TPA: hypothetical protein VHW47_01635, partial [Acidimicrobiales bacterium]|nr:hypothetical protein [Acidimicrobiales bacterium]